MPAPVPARAPVARARDPAREAARDAAREAAFERADALAAEKRATARRARDAFRRGTALDASGDHAGASRWLDRAHRLARADHTIGFALALTRLRAGDAAGAVAPLLAIHRALGLRQAAIALAIARWRQGLTAAAAHLLAGTLSGQLFDTGDPSLPAVADAIARDAGFDGWCAIGDDWVLRVRVSGGSGARAARDPDMRVPRDTEGRAPRAFELRRPRDFEVPASRDFEVRTSRDFEVRAWRDFEVRASRDGTPVGGGVAAIGRPFELGLGADGVLRADRLLVEAPEGVRLLAPSIDLAAIASLEGLVETDGAGGLQGWAWRPNAPAHAPVLTLARAADGRVLATVGTDAAIEPVIEGRTFGMVPRGFRVAAEHCPPGGLVLRDERGRPLGGSPVEAGIEVRAMAARADPDAPGAAADARRFAPVDARHVGAPARPRAAPGRRRVARAAPVAIVVPVYRGLRETRACLEAVFATVPAGTAVHVVDDGSPDAALVALIEREAEAGRIALHRHPDRANLGFPASANLGIARAAPEADVVLLNADAIPAGDWLARLRAAASAPGVASATPLSNEGSILSYPRACRPNPMPDARARARLASWAAAANPGETVEIPVGVGFCLLLRRAALDAVGVFRTDLFGRGYGEENDWCLRARHRGFRHVACLDAYVAHAGGASFGAGREALLRRNGAILERLHPGYDAMIAAFIAADPLAPYRRRLDRVRVLDEAASAGGEAVLFVTHAAGGGVERFVRARIADARRAGRRPVVLRGDPEGMRDDLCIVETGDAAGGDAAGAPANLRYALPDEAPALAALLASLGPVAVELHHLLGHDAAVPELLRSLGVPLDVWIHDYASFCHRIALFGPARRYCGEPDLAGCRACVAELGSLVDPAGDAWRGGDAGGARRAGGAERTDGATGAEPADGAGHAGRTGDTDDPRRANGAGDLGRGNGAGDPERAKGADDTGRVGASADVWRGGGAGGAERADGAGDAGRPDGASDAGRAAGAGDAGRVDGVGDAGRVNGVGDAGRVDGVGDAGRVAGAGDAGRVDAVGDAGRVDALLARSAALLGAARRVVAASDDVADRIHAHFPALPRPTVSPWEEEPVAAPPPDIADEAVATVVVPGAIGREKGVDVLLACARDARDRALPLRFTVVGHTAEDDRLLGLGVFVTGPYDEDEAVTLLRASGARLAFLPSVWPETWSYVLTECRRAGLRVACFAFGTPAARVAAWGDGVLLPPGLAPDLINDRLLAAARALAPDRPDARAPGPTRT